MDQCPYLPFVLIEPAKYGSIPVRPVAEPVSLFSRASSFPQSSAALPDVLADGFRALCASAVGPAAARAGAAAPPGTSPTALPSPPLSAATLSRADRAVTGLQPHPGRPGWYAVQLRCGTCALIDVAAALEAAHRQAGAGAASEIVAAGGLGWGNVRPDVDIPAATGATCRGGRSTGDGCEEQTECGPVKALWAPPFQGRGPVCIRLPFHERC